MQFMQSFALGLRAAFFVLFLVAAGSKMRSSAARQGFVRWVGDLAVVPQSAAGTVAQLTIALETVIAVLLLTPWAPVAFALAALVVFLCLNGYVRADIPDVRRLWPLPVPPKVRLILPGAPPAWAFVLVS